MAAIVTRSGCGVLLAGFADPGGLRELSGPGSLADLAEQPLCLGRVVVRRGSLELVEQLDHPFRTVEVPVVRVLEFLRRPQLLQLLDSVRCQVSCFLRVGLELRERPWLRERLELALDGPADCGRLPNELLARKPVAFAASACCECREDDDRGDSPAHASPVAARTSGETLSFVRFRT